MRSCILTFAFLLTVNALSAQRFDKRNSVMLESSFIMSLSISYDRIFPLGEVTALVCGGAYIMGVGFGSGSHWVAPEIGLLFFGPKHFLEIGADYAFEIFQAEEYNENSPGLRLGYRLQSTKGLTFRVNANAFFNIDPVFIPTIGLGYSF